jgi:alpha-L-arabinofuranosidase
MPNKASVSLDTDRVIGQISPLLFSGFAEHMGRCVYGGIYEPGSPHADASGLRQDVLEVLKRLGLRSIRYPGGNFVSGYLWQDGVGPKDQRPTKRELA